jgi:hypothetical protein
LIVPPRHDTGTAAAHRRPWAAIAAGGLLFAVLYLLMPPSPDQFNHAYLGWRLVQGERLNADVMDMNWPGIAWGHAAAAWLFGTRMWSWHAFDIGAFALALAALADIVGRGYGARAATALLLVGPWVYLASGYWIAGQHDMSAAQCLVIALWCHVRGGFAPRSWWTAGTGAALGLAVLHKPTMGALLPLLPLQGLALREGVVRVGAHAVLVACVAALVVAGGIGLLVWWGTPLANLVDAMWTYNATRRLDKPVDPMAVLRLTGSWPLALLLLSAPALAPLAQRDGRSVATTAPLLLWLTGVVSYAAQAKGNSYHLSPAVLAYMAWGAVVVSAAFGLGDARRPAWITRALAAALVAGVAVRAAASFVDLPRAIAARDFSLHLAHFRENDGLTLADVARLAREIAARDDSGCLLVAGRTSSVNVLAALRQPTRFYYFKTVQSPPPTLAERWTALWEADLARTTCRFVLVSDVSWQPPPTPTEHSQRVVAALRRWVDGAKSRRIGDSKWVLYERAGR